MMMKTQQRPASKPPYPRKRLGKYLPVRRRRKIKKSSFLSFIGVILIVSLAIFKFHRFVSPRDDMAVVMRQQMELNLLTLTPPAWPQLDDRTANAIASGVILGLDESTEFNFNNTIGKILIFTFSFACPVTNTSISSAKLNFRPHIHFII
jgi:hypothetical protein